MLSHGPKRLLLKQAALRHGYRVLNQTLIPKLTQSVKHLECVDFGRKARNIDTVHSFVLSSIAAHWQAGSSKHQRVKTSISGKLPVENIPTKLGSLQIKKRLHPRAILFTAAHGGISVQNAATALGHDDNHYLLKACWRADAILSTFHVFKAICEVGIIIYITQTRKRSQMV